MPPAPRTTPHRRLSGGWAFLWVTLAVIAVTVMPFVLFGDRIEAAFADGGTLAFLSSYGRYAWAVAVALLILDLILPIPTSAIMAALGMIYGPLLGGTIAGLGSIVAGLTGYGLCRALGRPMALWLSGAGGLRRGQEIFDGPLGGWLIALSRWLPILPEVLACLAGVSRMRFPVFLAALVCGSLP
ncbi:MAG TPA: VTT domain-containing protein, partial [Paracoccaceae bacterium]|nr:VTT domain-containing protein [Paracoccaceae bacterium]